MKIAVETNIFSWYNCVILVFHVKTKIVSFEARVNRQRINNENKLQGDIMCSSERLSSNFEHLHNNGTYTLMVHSHKWMKIFSILAFDFYLKLPEPNYVSHELTTIKLISVFIVAHCCSHCKMVWEREKTR